MLTEPDQLVDLGDSYDRTVTALRDLIDALAAFGQRDAVIEAALQRLEDVLAAGLA